VSVEVTASSSTVTATATGSAVQAAVGSTIVSASSSGGIGPQGPPGNAGSLDPHAASHGAAGADPVTIAASQLTGGALPEDAVLTFSDGTMDSEVGGWGFGVELTEGSGQFATVEYNAVAVTSAAGTVTLGTTGLTLPNAAQVVVGSFDNSTSGANGVSLVCAVGYELNWQGGRLRNVSVGGDGTPQMIYLDSPLTLPAAGLTFSDNTTQATAATVYTLPKADSATLGGILVGNGLVNFATGRVDVVYGTTSNTACQGNDSRLSNARTPSSHVHGNITNAGAIGSSSGQIVVTTTSGVLTTASSISLSQISQSSATTGQVVAWNGTAWAPAAGGGYTLPNATTSTLGGMIVGTGLGVTSGTVSVSYGSSSSTACVGNDSRLSDSRTPTAHNQAWSTITSTPTSLSGYGITDAVGSSDARLTDSRTPTAHTHGLGDLTQGGATNGQVIAWSGSAWAPATVSGGGGGSTSASDLTSGTLADARLSTNARQAVEQFVHPFLLMGG
jgi:hypothetical protein